MNIGEKLAKSGAYEAKRADRIEADKRRAKRKRQRAARKHNR